MCTFVYFSKIAETLKSYEVIDDPEPNGMPSAFLGKEKKTLHCC